jgi:hypothetical protein
MVEAAGFYPLARWRPRGEDVILPNLPTIIEKDMLTTYFETPSRSPLREAFSA